MNLKYRLFISEIIYLGLVVLLPNEIGKGIFMIEKHIKIDSEIIQNKSEERWNNGGTAL